MNWKVFCLGLVFSAILSLSLGYVQAQVPGFIPVFVDEFGTEDNSVIFQDPNGNIGIGTTSPTAKLDVAGGNVNLDNSTATTGNILKDGVPFIHNFGTNNTFIGIGAGNLTMTGVSNTASGADALSSNTLGFNNTASGAGALQNNIGGHSNTASGFQALQSNTSGVHNTASGFQALRSNINGFDNTATGQLALLFNTSGNQNTASGVGALQFSNAGSRNTAIGHEALQSNTTGNNNTAIGFRARVSAGNLNNATAIGSNAIANASNKIRLGDGNVTVIEGQVAYTFPSDKRQKETFKPVDGEEVLRKIGALSLTSWNYIRHDPKHFRHYGPNAQEFFAAFGHDGIGTIGTPTTINSGDMAGILMIAVQALEKRTTDLMAVRAENAELKARLEKLERRISAYALAAQAQLPK